MTSISSYGAGLPASLRTTILALYKTQNQIDQVQQRLASGLRVASAIDDPASYFTASALSHRAANLNNVLDGIISKLGTIEQANTSVTSLQELVTQAKDIAESADEELNGTTHEARITGDRSLTAFSDLDAVAGIDNGDIVGFSFVDIDGSIDATQSVTINTGDSASDLVNEINAIVNSNATQVFEASLNSSGQLTIKTNDNSRFEIEFRTSGSAADTQLASALGFNDFDTTVAANGTAKTRITVLAQPSLTSVSLYAVGGSAATTSTVLRNLTDTAGGVAGDIFNGDTGDVITIGINGGATITVATSPNTATLQNLIDGINDSGSLGTRIEATFNSTTSELNIRAIDSSVESIQIELVEDGSGAGTAGKIDLQQLGFGTRILQSSADGNGSASSESIQLGPVAATLADLEEEFNTVREQIDDLVLDSEFDDVNLLNDDNLTTYFNEDGTSSLLTEGAVFDADGLGISEANFGSSNYIDTAVEETTDALATVETFASGLANDIAIIEARQTFLEETINTLTAGAEDLTISDENEDSALLLTLQTRQLLGATGLSLGIQSQQSTLRLF